uniref:Neuropeptide-like 4 n=1 Tax=Panagrellus redivivus TaxID=6233 RepID=A0A7E4UWE5_PANRE
MSALKLVLVCLVALIAAMAVVGGQYVAAPVYEYPVASYAYPYAAYADAYGNYGYAYYGKCAAGFLVNQQA